MVNWEEPRELDRTQTSQNLSNCQVISIFHRTHLAMYVRYFGTGGKN